MRSEQPQHNDNFATMSERLPRPKDASSQHSDGPPDVVVGDGQGWRHAYPRGDLAGETVRRQVDEVVSERSE